MAWIRQENGNTIGYAIAPPSSEAELWFEVAEDDPRVTNYLNPPVPEPTLESAIALTQKSMQDYADLLLEQSVTGYGPIERDTWAKKSIEAIAALASSNSTDAPYLQIEAIAAGIPLLALAQIVDAKAIALQSYTAQILGNRALHYHLIGELPTVEAAQNYDFSAGWIF
jgi:hypothetical protein